MKGKYGMTEHPVRGPLAQSRPVRARSAVREVTARGGAGEEEEGGMCVGRHG